MNCNDARLLVRTGVLPGTAPGRNPELGFHLAGCPACRAFREAMASPSRRAPAAAGRRGAKGAGNVRGQSRGMVARRAAQLVTATLVVFLLFAGWYLLVPLARAWSDLKAMSSLPPVRSAPYIARGLRPVDPPGTPDKAGRPATGGQAGGLAAATDVAPPTRTVRRPLFLSPTLPPEPTGYPTPTATELPTVTPAQPPTPTLPPPPAPAEPPPSDAKTILLLGIDARPGEGFLARSDAVMVVRLDPAQNRVAFLSLPRDLWVAIPGAGEGKLNSAYMLGERQGQGAAVAAAAVSNALGIAIDHAVVVDFGGFRGIVDTVGGVPVEIPKELYDPRFPTEDYGYMVAHFLPGMEVMNGERALMFSRIRHPDSDFERMRRQQLVLLGIARKLGERGILASLQEADQMTSALLPFVRTDMPPGLALNLLWSLRSVDPGAVQRLTADTSVLGEANIGGGYALVAGDAVLQSLGAQLIAAP